MKKNRLALQIFVGGSVFLLGVAAACASTIVPPKKQNIVELQNKIDAVQQKISQLTVGSIITDPFKAEIQQVQAMATQAGNLDSADEIKVQTVVDIANRKLDKLDQLVDLTSGSSDDMSNDNASELQDIKQEIENAQLEINKISLNGTDVTNLKNILQDVKNIVSSAQDAIGARNMQAANLLIKKAHDRLDNLNESIDGALDIDYDGGRKLIRNYDSNISDVVLNLKSLAEIEQGTSQQFENVATQQDDSIAAVRKIVTNISARKGLVKFLLGANFGALENLRAQIQQNKASIATLKLLLEKMNDSATQAVLRTQIQAMAQQTAALESFMQTNDGGYSLLGWAFKYL